MKKEKVKNIYNTGVEKNYHNWEGTPILTFGKNFFSPNKPKLVDLFCGCGGVSVGFEMAGFETVFSNDIHPPSIATISKNHPNTNIILGDIQKVKDETVMEACSGQSIDVVFAGVPCQGFSLCNRKRHEKDERNFLFWEFIRVVNILKPKYVVLENVSGMRTLNGGTFIDDIKKAISEAGNGYDVDCKTLRAQDYGVPQRRDRVFFVGASNGYVVRWPKKTHGVGNKPLVTVGDAIGDLPSLKSGEEKTEYDKAPQSEYQREMRKGSKRLYNHEAPSHPEETIKKIGNTKPGQPMYPKFKQRIRLAIDILSPTQVSGGIRPQFQLGHPVDPRGLSVRERCRIQSFPDKYVICGGTVQGRVQTGNAVPPLLAKAVASEIKNGIQNKPITDNTLQKEPSQMVFFETA